MRSKDVILAICVAILVLGLCVLALNRLEMACNGGPDMAAERELNHQIEHLEHLQRMQVMDAHYKQLRKGVPHE